MIYNLLREKELEGEQISVGLIGAGCMGKGICHQLSITPGMQMKWVADIDLNAAQAAAALTEDTIASNDVCSLIQNESVDVVVESSNSILAAFEYCKLAIESGSHVVLMNAEVDLAYGPELRALADKHQVIVTSDAGDQHGVIATMIDEIKLWGFQIIQAGNIKGFLNRYATADQLLTEADKRNLNPIQCCAYTDGTKLNIEMAVLANAYGFKPTQIGMEGPKVAHVNEVLDKFDFTNIPVEGSIDYILGAEPGGGVYVIGKCDNPVQTPYLNYYKLGEAPYYLFYRPYHLCHLETTTAIAKAVFFKQPILSPPVKKICDVYAIAKKDIAAGTEVDHAIGGDHFYGVVATVEEGEAGNWVPIHSIEENKFLLTHLLQQDHHLSQSHLIPLK